MSDVIQEMKKYIETPEGSEWFMNAVKSVQEKIRVSEESKPLSHTASGEDVKNPVDKAAELKPVKKGGNVKPLVVSRRELENVIQWTEQHPDREIDGRYILRVASAGGRQVLKPTLLMRGEVVSSSQLVTDDPKKILSGDITKVTTRGAHTETYNLTLTD